MLVCLCSVSLAWKWCEVSPAICSSRYNLTPGEPLLSREEIWGGREEGGGSLVSCESSPLYIWRNIKQTSTKFKYFLP